MAIGSALTICSEVRADEVSTFAEVQSSLGLVASHDKKGVAFGTAFCIENRDQYGFLLTNRHVVGNDRFPLVVLMSDPKTVLRSVVVRVATIDAAVLAIRKTCKPVQMASAVPPVGTRVGIAGFPAFQLMLFQRGLGLAPSFHEGSISSVIDQGGFLEYDAQTDHGNSGSPLFGIESGEVYGLVMAVNTGKTGALQNNVAVGVAALAPFLQNADHQIAEALQSRNGLCTPNLRQEVKLGAPSERNAHASFALT